MAPEADAPHTAQRDAQWALAFAIASLIFCAPITAPLAFWKASRAMRHGPSGMATVAIIFAVFGLCSSALLFLFIVIWQFLTPAVAAR